MGRKYLTEFDVAERTQISLGTLRRWRLENKGPRYRKFGSLVRYDEEDLAAWEQAQTGGGHERPSGWPRLGITRPCAPGDSEVSHTYSGTGMEGHTRYTTHSETMPTTSPKMGRKIKKSFSISVESDSFIRRSCKERKSNSESETLDALLGELMTARQQKAIESAYADYYDSLSELEVAEESAWGAFVESQLAKEIR